MCVYVYIYIYIHIKGSSGAEAGSMLQRSYDEFERMRNGIKCL